MPNPDPNEYRETHHSQFRQSSSMRWTPSRLQPPEPPVEIHRYRCSRCLNGRGRPDRHAGVLLGAADGLRRRVRGSIPRAEQP